MTENGITIVADQIEIVPVADLDTSFNRVKIHSSDQVALLAGMMGEFGFTVPLLIDESGGVIAGKGRLLAAIMLGMTRVPCVRSTHLSRDQIRALVIADNKISESSWDMGNLKIEMEALKAIDDELMSMTGFNFEEIDDLLDGVMTEECDDGPDEPKLDFLNVGPHKIEITTVEKKRISEALSQWFKRNGSYYNAVTTMSDALKDGH